MKVLVISSSLRANSNSEALADKFIQGALEAGAEVEKISLKDKDIRFCKGCLACQRPEVKDMFSSGDCSKACPIKDDIAPIIQKMYSSDAICFASPIYYYEMSGQLKTLLDRANPLFTSDYKFRDIYFLTSAAEEEETVPSRAISGIEGWIECYEKARLAGTVFAGGVTNVGEIAGNSSLEKAYELGKRI